MVTQTGSTLCPKCDVADKNNDVCQAVLAEVQCLERGQRMPLSAFLNGDLGHYVPFWGTQFKRGTGKLHCHLKSSEKSDLESEWILNLCRKSS